MLTITNFNCPFNLSEGKGYHCNDPQTECQAFLTFRSTSLYNLPLAIASLLHSDALDIAKINNIKSTADEIPFDNLVIVPVPCDCTGSIYLHQANYTTAAGDTYYHIANYTFQGLLPFQLTEDRNYYSAVNLTVGGQLMIPLRCACPSADETANGVKSLLTYLVTHGDSVDSITESFGITAQSFMEANMMTSTSVLCPSIPILIPLNCVKNSKNSFCYCPNGYAEGGLRNGLNCMPDQKKFPFKPVLVIGSHQSLC